MSHDAVALLGTPRAPAKRRSSVLAALAFALFLASLLLPAVHMVRKGDGWLVDLNGIMALYFSVASAIGSVVEGAAKADGVEVGSVYGLVVCGAAALFNVLFLLPLAWMRRSRERSPSRGLAVAWGCGTALALAAPLAMFGIQSTTALGIGYLAWIAAWVALGAALWAARREAVTP